MVEFNEEEVVEAINNGSICGDKLAKMIVSGDSSFDANSFLMFVDDNIIVSHLITEWDDLPSLHDFLDSVEGNI